MLLVAAALAAAPRVDPAVESDEVEAAYARYAEAQGRPEAARRLVCRPFAERTRLCFTRVEGGLRSWYVAADAKPLATLEAAARGSVEDAVKRLEPISVDGFSTLYWMAANGDGRDHAALLHPDALRKRLGGDFVVATPARGVLVAWLPGDVVFDKIVAVGVRRMYETLPDPVSPLLYKWTGEAWITWGEAREVPGADGPAPVSAPAEFGGPGGGPTAPLAPAR